MYCRRRSESLFYSNYYKTIVIQQSFQFVAPSLRNPTPRMAPRLCGISQEALEIVTDGFCEDNIIGRFQFGKVYRGVGEYSDLTVKLFEKVDNYEVWPGDNEGRVQDEYRLIYDDRVVSHPNMVTHRAKSYPTERPAVVYEMKTLDTVHNLLDKDSFSWLQRIKVAYGFASVVSSFHDCRPIPYIIRNISAAHIMLDQDYYPKLYDFSMISGGYLADKRELLNQYVHGCHGYVDPDYVCNGKWSEKCDVFAFGVVLLSLISKKVVLDKAKTTNAEPFLYEWAYSEYQKKEQGLKLDICKLSLVHRGLEEGPLFSLQDGVTLTKLAMQCVDLNPLMRPTMNQVVQRMRKLCIIQNHPDLFDLENTPTASNFNISGIGKLFKTKFEVYLKMPRAMPKALFEKFMENDNSKLIEKELQYRAPIILTYDDLKRITDEFSGDNYIDIHQFGKLYHGKIGGQVVTVKTLEATVGTSIIKDGDNENRLNDELVLLQHPRFISHPNIMKLIGYCYEDGRLGAVYDLESLDCLVNLIEKDGFSWGCRIDFALKLAGLIKFLQDSKPPYTSYLLRNLFPNNILVDKGYNPKLFNFGMITGGILNDRERVIYVHGWKYYIDPHTNCYECYTKVSDIYSFGMVLLNLITKKLQIGDDPDFDTSIQNLYEQVASRGRHGLKHFSLANEDFKDDPDFDIIQGRRVTRLAMQCIHGDFWERPTIGQVVSSLKKLKTARTQGDSGQIVNHVKKLETLKTQRDSQRC